MSIFFILFHYAQEWFSFRLWNEIMTEWWRKFGVAYIILASSLQTILDRESTMRAKQMGLYCWFSNNMWARKRMSKGDLRQQRKSMNPEDLRCYVRSHLDFRLLFQITHGLTSFFLDHTWTFVVLSEHKWTFMLV